MTRTGTFCWPGAVAVGGMAERSAPDEQPDTAIQAMMSAAPVREHIEQRSFPCSTQRGRDSI
jgi:hypothetical protein